MDEKFPLFLGGEHLITYPIIKYMAKKITWIIVIIFLAAGLLFSIFYTKIKHYWLPEGHPGQRPVEEQVDQQEQ